MPLFFSMWVIWFTYYSDFYSDEADVFLESRGRGVGTSTEKNALVSGMLKVSCCIFGLYLTIQVFLRVLEYYQGMEKSNRGACKNFLTHI